MNGGNLSPRQKMIGMMYLVLTALLALNVSKDILDAFVLINTSLENTVVNYNKKNEILYSDFNKAKSFDPNKVTPFWEKAQLAKKHSSDLIKYIKELQIKLIQETEKITNVEADTLQLNHVTNKDNYDIPTYIMIGQSEDGSTGLARELKNKLDNYKIIMLGLFNEQERKTLNIDLKTDDVKSREGIDSWEIGNFYHTPLAATITLLSKIKTDIKNVEYEVVNKLYQSAGKEGYNFDTVAAKIIPTSKYILLGENYDADVFVAAFSTTQNPEILIGEYDFEKNKLLTVEGTVPVTKGVGNYSIKTTREGIFNYEGVIKLKNLGIETPKQYPFKSEYIVAKPSLVVSPEKMNVLYIGPDNPVLISVPGVASERISATITGIGNRISKTSNGHYNVKLSSKSPLNINIIVNATMTDGTQMNMGKMTFEVKRLPKPYAEVGYVSLVTGEESIDQLKAHTKVTAKYDPSFPFSGLPVNIEKYKVEIYRGAKLINSWKKNDGAITVNDRKNFNKLRRNDMVYFTNIFARDVCSQVCRLNDVTIKVR
jgi:gliding motility-associated protein GldM